MIQSQGQLGEKLTRLGTVKTADATIDYVCAVFKDMRRGTAF